MGFVKIVTTRAVQQRHITGAFATSKTGKGTFYVTLPTSIAGAAWEKHDTCDVLLGEGDDAGLFNMQPTKDGVFKISRFKDSLVVRIPRQPSWVCEQFGSAPLDVMSSEKGGFTLRLPAELFTPPAQHDAAAGQAVVRPPGVGVPAQQAGVRPPLSLLGTTLSRGGYRDTVKLTKPQFRMFNALWKAWGEPVRMSAVMLAVDDQDIDTNKLMISLMRDIECLGLWIEQVGGSMKLVDRSPRA